MSGSVEIPTRNPTFDPTKPDIEGAITFSVDE
jgi:hypothetical protein